MLAPAPASATMPALNEMPDRHTEKACWLWAKQEVAREAEVLTMWGLRGSGESDPRVATARLAGYCLGKHVPDIVYVYASAGSAQSYCRSHARQTVCLRLHDR